MYREYATRRQIMRYGTLGALGGLAGCMGGDSGGGNGNGGDDTPTPTPVGNGDSDEMEPLEMGIAAPVIAFPIEEPLGKSFGEDYNVDFDLKSTPATPSDMIQLFVAGDGQEQFDAIWDNGGGMEDLLAEREAIVPIKKSKIKGWDRVSDNLRKGNIHGHTIRYDGNLVGGPSSQNVDSVAYDKEAIDEPDSWGVMFDDEHKGEVGLLDDYGHPPNWTALYLRENDPSDIHNVDYLTDDELETVQNIEVPHNLKPDEIEAVVNYLIKQKKAGQFKTIFKSFEAPINLLVNKEVVVTNAYEPAVFLARDRGAKVGYPPLREGCYEWNDNWYMTAGCARRNNEEAFYRLATWSLTEWYGTELLSTRGYLPGISTDHVLDYAEENSDEYDVDRLQTLIDQKDARYSANGDVHVWNNPNPDHLDKQLDEWNRFLSA